MTMLLLAAALAQPDPLTFSGAGMDLTVRQGGFRSDPRRVIIERADPAHYDPELPEAGDAGPWKARRRADRTERQFLRPSEKQLDKLTRARYLEPAEARQTGEYGVGGEEPFYKVEVNPSYPFPDLFHKKVRLRPRAIAPSPRVPPRVLLPAPRIAPRRRSRSSRPASARWSSACTRRTRRRAIRTRRRTRAPSGGCRRR